MGLVDPGLSLPMVSADGEFTCWAPLGVLGRTCNRLSFAAQLSARRPLSQFELNAVPLAHLTRKHSQFGREHVQ